MRRSARAGLVAAVVVAAVAYLPVPAGAALPSPLPAATTGAASAGRPGTDTTTRADSVSLEVTRPAVTWLSARRNEARTVFTARFPVREKGERLFVLSSLVVDGASTRAFVEHVVECRDPAGKRQRRVATGANVWPSSGDDLMLTFVLTAGSTGTWSCVTRARVCIPGVCQGDGAAGRVRVVSRQADPEEYSSLVIAGPLPASARDQQVPGPWDTLIRPGGDLRLSATFTVPRDRTDVLVGSTLSLTTCIERGFPPVCSGVAAPNPHGRSVFALGLTARQLPRTVGAACGAVTASEDTGAGRWAIGWEQHHANVSILASLAMVDDPGCSGAITVTTTIGRVSGNPLAVHSGTVSRPTSVTFVVP